MYEDKAHINPNVFAGIEASQAHMITEFMHPGS